MIIGTLRTPVDAADVGSINRLLRQLSPHAPPRFRSDIEAAISPPAAAPGSRVFIVRGEGGVIVGMASVFVVPTLLKRVGHVEDVVVDGSMRGQGLGKVLMAEIFTWARVQRLNCLELTSGEQRIEARTLYESLGFKQRRPEDCYRCDLAKT